MPMVWSGWKTTNFFLNLEKTNASQGTVKKIEINNKKIDYYIEINKVLGRFFENLFKRNLRKINIYTMNFL